MSITASCPNCGAVFNSAFADMFGGNVRGLSMRGNVETCPQCGALANTAEGTFDIIDGVAQLIAGNKFSANDLAAFEKMIRESYLKKSPSDQLVKEASALNPALGEAVRMAASGGAKTWATMLVFMFLMVKSCSVNVDVKLDLNQLIDQYNKQPVVKTLMEEQLNK